MIYNRGLFLFFNLRATVNTLFISDLHLDPQHPEMIRVFYHFITHEARQADALYILGDLFEYWLGDDDQTELSIGVRRALRSLTEQNVPVYVMQGNRDFLLGHAFAASCGATLLPDPTVIELYGRRTLLMHGDTLCTDDRHYQQFRRVIRHPLLTRFFLTLPRSLRQQCARFLRWRSQSQTAQKPLDIMDVTPAAVIHTMEKYNVDLLIHGHTHRGAMHSLEIFGKPAQRIVLDAWHQHGNVLICDTLGNLRSEPLLCNAS